LTQPPHEERQSGPGDRIDQKGAPGPPTPRPADIGLAMDLGMRLGLSVAGGLVIGYLADGWLHTGPVLTLGGLALGLGAAGYSVWTVSKRYMGK